MKVFQDWEPFHLNLFEASVCTLSELIQLKVKPIMLYLD